MYEAINQNMYLQQINVSFLRDLQQFCPSRNLQVLE